MWWVPVVIGAGAALASYYATWRFKKTDVERESALRAADLVDEAERILAARGDNHEAWHLVSQARIRCEPLASSALDDRFRAALSFLWTVTVDWEQPGRQAPPGGRRWLTEAVANLREGLVPYLRSPRFIPFSAHPEKRSFPTLAELEAMPRDDDGRPLILALEDWRRAHPY